MSRPPQPSRRGVLGAAGLAALGAGLSAACGSNSPDSESQAAAAGRRAGWVSERAAAFAGYGAWWDAYDWAPTMNPQGPPVMGLEDAKRLAEVGTKALYIQTAHRTVNADIIDPEVLEPLIESARTEGLRVISWYLPEHIDVDLDTRRLAAPIDLGVDGIGIDLESDAEKDIEARNAGTIATAEDLRRDHPDTPMTAIVNPPVLYDELNDWWWPGFPWQELGPYFDTWMPMAYWSLREGEWADPGRYVAENVRRVRSHVGDPGLPVHPIGGLAEKTDADAVQAMGEAMRETDCIGGSLYDDRTTSAVLYGVMAQEFTS